MFLGGLLRPLSEIEAEKNPDEVLYEFMDGVRELLLDSVSSDYVLNVVDEVSKYVARKVGLSLEDFAAVLRSEKEVGDSRVAGDVGYFATVTAQVLRCLGGEYAKVADELEKYELSEKQERIKISHYTIEELLELYLQGNLDICEQLLKHPDYLRRVELIARQQTIATGLHWEDAVQEIHIKILEGMRDRRFRWGGEREFDIWLAKVAENTILSLLRREHRTNKWTEQSLDQFIKGTNIQIKDNLADNFNLADAVEFSDTVLKVIQAIKKIDSLYPGKNFLQLWQELSKDKKQEEIARDLQVSQGEISKRKRELVKLVALEIGLVNAGQIKQELQDIRQGKLKLRESQNISESELTRTNIFIQEIRAKVLKLINDIDFTWNGDNEFYSWLEKVIENMIYGLINEKIEEFIKEANPQLDNKLNLVDEVELNRSFQEIQSSVEIIDKRYPKKQFIKLWQGLIKGKKQGEIARELQVKQGEVSKRKRELIEQVALELKIIDFGRVKQELQDLREGKLKLRKRLDNSW